MQFCSEYEWGSTSIVLTFMLHKEWTKYMKIACVFQSNTYSEHLIHLDDFVSTYARILKAHSHSMSGGPFYASLGCSCCFWIIRWRAVAYFGISAHKLPVEFGRYNNMPYEERFCTICQSNAVGNKFHYLMSYTNENLSRIRNIFLKDLCNINRSYCLLNPNNLFIYIMKIHDKYTMKIMRKYCHDILSSYENLHKL